MKSYAKLIYGYDSLCGWCYAFIPALHEFSKAFPSVDVEVVPGGLFSDEKVKPYTQMEEYIVQAFTRIEKNTSRFPKSDAFFNMISSPETGLINSAPPTHALMQVKKNSPDKHLEFAHRLQTIHFDEGLSFNNPVTYQTLSRELNISFLDTEAILSATDDTPLVKESYFQAKQLGIRSYPKCLVLDKDDRVLGEIDAIYDAEKFAKEFESLTSH